MIMSGAASCSAAGSGGGSGGTSAGGAAGSGAGATGGTAAVGGAAGTLGIGGTSATGPGGAGGLMTDAGQTDTGVCGSVELPAEVVTVEVEVPGNVLVVFDASNSMGTDFPTPSGPKPKWQAAGDALIAAIDPIKDKVNVGVVFFPTIAGTLLLCSSDAHELATPQQIFWTPGASFSAAWNSWWATYGLKLGTPLNRATDRAATAIQNMTLPGSIAVVLLSDGEPVCVDGVPAPQRAAQWLTQGIKTYVVGLSSAAIASAFLNDVATQGGTGPTALGPSDSAALEAELAKIAQTTITTEVHIDSCELTLDPPPPNTNDVHVIVEQNGQSYEVPRDDPDGWSLSPDGTKATLSGKACQDALDGKFSAVRVEFGCVEVPPLPK